MFYRVFALDHQAVSRQLPVQSVTNLTAFYGGVTLRWLLCSDLSFWNLSYVSGLLRQRVT